MSDRDRKALPSEAIITAMADTWAERTGIAEKLKTLPSNLPTAEMRQRHDELVLRHVKLSYEEGVAAGWEAARDHHAPKLTEKEAVERAVEAIRLTPKKRVVTYRKTVAAADGEGSDMKVTHEIVNFVEDREAQARAALSAAGTNSKEDT